MSAVTEPVRWQQPPAGSDGAALKWLDALVGGLCTPEAFLAAARDQFQGGGDAGWEVLSLLDQYYRRGKIKAELFHTLKSRLESSALNAGDPAAASVRPHSASVTAPAAASQAPAAQAPAAAPHSARDVAVGDVLRDRYWIRGILGHGGMGTVFEAIDQYRLDLPSVSQRLAVKILHTAVTQRQELLAELQREFQHLQLLSHPNIVRVHEFDRDGDLAFFTMELLDGALLSAVLSERNLVALPRPYALAIMRDVGAALAHAHARGVVHGDINPQNIFITHDGELRVLDFGASQRVLGDRWTSADAWPQRVPVATPGFASCQLLEGRHPDARDDVFAFACVAYTLLSGRHPFPKRTAIEASAQRLRAPRPPGLARRQWRVLSEGLRWERERRPSDVQEWLERFELAAAASRLPSLPALVHAPTPRRSRVLSAGAAVSMLGLLAALGYWAATDTDSLARRIRDWSDRARTALDGVGAPAAAPEPLVTQPTAPAAVSRAAPAPRANPEPSPTASSTAKAPPAKTRSSPTGAVTRPSAGKPPVRAGNTGPIHLEMAADTVEVPATETTARVAVRRSGSLHGDAGFAWWTESGTAKPGQDFLPVMPRAERIADGSGGVSLSIPLSGTRTRPKSFYVVIDRTPSGAAPGPRTLTMVTLLPPD